MQRRLAVDEERWRRAQAWELEYWRREQTRRGWKKIVFPVVAPFLRRVGSPRVTGDDSNLWWRDQFDQYSFLPSHLGNYLELGCGPYTNTRLILEGRTADRVVCSDPLVGEYLKFRGRWLAEAVAKGIVEVDDHPIEETPFERGSFDTVVLINVLDHVRDCDLCMETAIDLLRPGGCFVYGQDIADQGTVGRYEWFEEGHPIRPTADDVEKHLGRLDPILHRTVPPRDPRLQTGVLVFAGSRR